MSKQFDEINALSAQLTDLVKVENDGIVADKELYTSVLPADIDAEVAKKVHDFDAAYAAATMIAVGNHLKDSDLEQLTGSFETDNGSVEHTIHKSIDIGGETKNGYVVTAVNFVTAGKEDVMFAAAEIVASYDYSSDLESDD